MSDNVIMTNNGFVQKTVKTDFSTIPFFRLVIRFMPEKLMNWTPKDHKLPQIHIKLHTTICRHTIIGLFYPRNHILKFFTIIPIHPVHCSCSSAHQSFYT